MHRHSKTWLIVLAAVLLVPLGIRALTWQRAKLQPVDPALAHAGEVLFKHDWQVNDKLSPGGDGLGPVFNAKSCVFCHDQGGPGGGGGTENNVTMFVVMATDPGGPSREGVVHSRATKFGETLQQVHPDLPPISKPALEQLIPLATKSDLPRITVPSTVRLSQRSTPALFGARLIDAIPAADIIAMEKKQRLRFGLASAASETLPVGRAVRLADGRVGRFGWKGQTASLADFVQAACANELGLGNPGQPQPVPMSKTDYRAPGFDLTQEQCDQITAFVASLPTPVEWFPPEALAREDALAGKRHFGAVGCADCHVPDLSCAEGMYSDLLLHFMGVPLEASGVYYGPPPETPIFKPGEAAGSGEWRTPPLWGVADSAPYLHDGRAATLEEAINLHGGQGKAAAVRFGKLTPREQGQLVKFLKTLRAPGAPSK